MSIPQSLVDDYDDLPKPPRRHPLRARTVVAALTAVVLAGVTLAFLAGYGLGYQSGYVDGEVAITNPPR